MRRSLPDIAKGLWHNRRTEILLFICAFALRAVLCVSLAWLASVAPDFDRDPRSAFPVVGGDSLDYATIARNIAESGQISSSMERPLVPESFRAPGYPLFLSVFLESGLGYMGATAAQIAFASLSVVLLFAIARRFIGRRAAMVAAAIFTLEPNAAYYSVIALSDALFVFLELVVALLVIWAAEADRSRATALLLGAGLLFGYAILVRPIAQFLPAAFIVALLALSWSRWSARATAKAVLAFALGIIIVVAPWSMRNERIFGTYEISSVSSVAFHAYNAPMFYSYKNGVSYDEAKRVFEGMVPGDPTSLEYRSLWNASKLREAAFGYISSDVAGYAAFHILKTAPFFVTDGLRDILATVGLLKNPQTNASDLLISGRIGELARSLAANGPSLLLLGLGTGFWLIVHLASAYGLFDAVRRGDRRRAWFIAACAMSVLYFAILTGPVANSRYRLPAEPFMLMAAGAGLVAAYEKARPAAFNQLA